MKLAMLRPSWLAVIIATLALHVVALWFIFRYTTTYPLAIDEWLHFVPRNVQFLDGELSLSDAVSAKSRVADAPPALNIYPWLAILPNLLLFEWNLQLDSLINYLLIVANTILVLRLLVRHQRQLLIGLLLPVTALMLAVQQRWNLIVGVHSAIHMQLLFSLASFGVLTAPGRSLRHVLVAAIIAFIGTFASLIGWLTWIIALPAMWFLKYRDWRAYAIWIIGFVIAALALFNLPGASLGGGHYATEASGNPSLLKEVMGYVMFTLAYLGGVFASGPDSNIAVAFLLGIMGLIIFPVNLIHLWSEHRYRDFLVVCSMLAAYGFIYGGMAAVGRLHQFGVRWGMAHHYISMSVLFWIGLIGLVALMLWRSISKQGNVRPSLLMINTLMITIASFYYLVGAYGTVQVAEDHRQFVKEAEACIVETAHGLWPDSDGCEVVGGLALPQWIDDLYEHHLTGFAQE